MNAVGLIETLCSVQPFNPFDNVDANRLILALENCLSNGTSKVRKDKKKQVLFESHVCKKETNWCLGLILSGNNH